MVRLSSIVIASLVASSAWAQQPPAVAAGRCTGVLCDLYYSGKPAPAPGVPEAPDPTHLPCHDFLCAAFGGRTQDTPPPVAEPVASPEPARPVTSKRKKTARAMKPAAPTMSVDATKAETSK